MKLWNIAISQFIIIFSKDNIFQVKLIKLVLIDLNEFEYSYFYYLSFTNNFLFILLFFTFSLYSLSLSLSCLFQEGFLKSIVMYQNLRSFLPLFHFLFIMCLTRILKRWPRGKKRFLVKMSLLHMGLNVPLNI